MSKRLTKYFWDELSRDDQDQYLTILWNDGYSEGAIAKFFNVGKGTIVRRRQSHLKDLKPRDRSTVKSELTLERFHDLLDIDEMDDMRDQGVIPIGPVAASEEVPTVDHPLPALPQFCQWPMPGRSLKVHSICGERVTTIGENLCDTHLAELKKLR